MEKCMKCNFCRWAKGHHDENCPNSVCDDNDTRMTQWNRGYKDGRSGAVNCKANDENETYVIGYATGNIALEEAQNGFNPVIEGHQW